MNSITTDQQAGFTLLEVLLGITILSVSMLIVLNSLSASLSLIDHSEVESQALQLARSTMERVKMIDPSTLVANR